MKAVPRFIFKIISTERNSKRGKKGTLHDEKPEDVDIRNQEIVTTTPLPTRNYHNIFNRRKNPELPIIINGGT
jgi:hypothetical protein